jgi:TPR repeat protein
MSINKFLKLFILSAGIFIFSAAAPLSAAETAIKGKVSEIDGSRVKIEYEGKYAPNVGDSLKIGFKLGDDFIPVEGDWKIVEVNSKFVWVEAKGGDAGTPALDYLAVIQSNNPKARSARGSKKEKPGEKAKKPSGKISAGKTADDIYKEALTYYNGHGVAKDHNKAFGLFKKSAGMGHPLAQDQTGWMYQYGQGVKKNMAKAEFWYKKAADQNNWNAKNNLGIMYLDGIGVKKDYALAHRLFQEAGDGGNKYGYWNLGRMYNFGWGVAKNLETAFSYYMAAAVMGHANAQDKVGECYMNGTGVKKDYAQSYKWCKKAADQGFARGYNNLGLIYLNAFGKGRDYHKAHELFGKAAAGGYKWGYFNLGRLYDNGWGVQLNEQKALEYYRKFGDHISAYKDGARKGHKEAQEWLRKRNMNW